MLETSQNPNDDAALSTDELDDVAGGCCCGGSTGGNSNCGDMAAP